VVVEAPQQGAVFYDKASGALVYLPDSDFQGADSFEFATTGDYDGFSFTKVAIDGEHNTLSIVSAAFGDSPGVMSGIIVKKEPEDGGEEAPGDQAESPPAETTGDEDADHVDGTGARFLVIIHVDQPGDGGDRDTYEITGGGIDVGHTFISVIDGDTGDAMTVGFYPEEPVSPIDPEADGQLVDDSGHSWDVQHEYPLTEEQYEELLDLIEEAKKDPPEYDLNDNNCVDWAIDLLDQLGLDVPDTEGSWPGGGGSNTGDLGEDLIQEGGQRNEDPETGDDEADGSSKYPN
jgi:hypothetical protein